MDVPRWCGWQAGVVKNDDGSVNAPIGTILYWSGGVDTIPVGFALCDGNNGTVSSSKLFGGPPPARLVSNDYHTILAIQRVS